MREVALPSGAILKIISAPFADSKELYMVVAEELKGVRLNMAEHVSNLYKDLFCAAVSSKKVDASLQKCLARCLYNGEKITADTWEKVEAREDYMQACVEVAKDNILPFTKSLYAQFSPLLGSLVSDLTSELKETTQP